MAEGRRFTPENPSPAMKSFAAFIKDKGYDDSTDLETTVAATFVFHREWQQGHASELAGEREAARKAREEAKAAKAAEREEKKAQREAAKAEREAEREEKKRQREEAKAEKEAKAAQEAAANGDDSDEGEGEGKPRRRLRLKKENDEAAEATVDAESGSL